MEHLINWIGIDDHADKWTLAHFEGAGRKAREWELKPEGISRDLRR